jgi:hypothetical protein
VITVGVIAVFLFAADAESLTFQRFVGVTSTPQSLLLPVLAILTVTTEWTQRTGLVTFTLEPRRSRVVLAKLVAVITLGLLAVALAVTAAAVANLVAGTLMDGAGSWDLAPANARDLVLMQVVAVLQGFAFGMLLMSTPAAIVAYYVLPLLWSTAFALVDALQDAAPWLDLNSAIAPLFAGSRCPATTGRTSPSPVAVGAAAPGAGRPPAAAPRGQVQLSPVPAGRRPVVVPDGHGALGVSPSSAANGSRRARSSGRCRSTLST